MKLVLIFLLFISFLYSKDLKPISIQLKWKHQFQFAGFYVAKELGLYEKYGLDVSFEEFDGSFDPLNRVLEQKSNFGIDDSSLVYHKLNGNDVVALFAIFKTSPIALLSQEKFNTIKSLKNKDIEFSSNEISNISINAIFKSQDIHVNNIKHTFYSKSFKEKKSDAIVGYLSNQPHILDKENIKYNIFLPKDYGFDFYGDMIYTSLEFAKQNPIIVKNFIEATKKGWEYAFKNIPYSVDLIYEKYNSQNKSKDSLFYEANILKEFSDYENKEFGEIDKFKIKEIANTIKLIYPQRFRNNDLNDFIWNNKVALIDYYKKNYLQFNKDFTVCIQDNLFPIDGIDNNRLVGISGEILNTISEKFEFNLKPINAKNYQESIQNVFENKCNILTISAEDSYKQYKIMDRTNFYLESNLAIITKIDKPFIENNNNLNEKRFVVRYEVIKKYLLSYYPNIQVEIIKDLERISTKLKDDEIDGFITDNITVDRMIQKLGFNEFKISGFINKEPIKIAFAVSKDKPELREILNLGLSYFSKEDIEAIEEKYKVTRYSTIINKNLIWKILILFTIISLTILFSIFFLKRKNDELNEWLNSTIEGVALFENKKLLRANTQLLKILGYDNFKEIQNKTYFDFISPKDHHIIKEKLKEDQEAYELTFIKKDGSLMDGLVKGHNIKGSTNKRISVIIDITELKKTQRELKELNQTLNLRIEDELQKNHEQRVIMFQQAKLAEIGSMINMIAHQWRQPLNNISLLVNTIIIKYKKDTLSVEMLNKLKENFQEQINYLSNTIDDFQNFFKPKKDKEIFVINEIILSTLNLIKPKFEKNRIKTNFNSITNINYFGYKNELAQVLLTILNNSLDAFEENNVLDKLIEIDLETLKENIIIKVRDNAGGIKEENLKKVFDLYFSTKIEKNGTGLGLYISKTIINRHFKGEIKIHNIKKGAEIIITFPKNNI